MSCHPRADTVNSVCPETPGETALELDIDTRPPEGGLLMVKATSPNPLLDGEELDVTVTLKE